MNDLHTLTQRMMVWIFTAITLLASGAVHATQADLDKEVKNYIDVFTNQGQAQQRKAIETLSWSGHSEPELFDKIEARLLAGYKTEDKHEAEKLSWQAKALALSGNPKYRKTLEEVHNNADNRKLRRHSETALERLEKYESWNPVIAKDLDKAPAGKLEETRIKNMLASDNPELVRIGAKRVYHKHYNDDELLEAAKTKLLMNYPNAEDKLEVDAMAWLCKALAQSGKTTYGPVLQEVADNAPNRKVAKYAKKYARSL